MFLGGLEPVFFSQQKILTWPVLLFLICRILIMTLSTYISQKSTGSQWNVNSRRGFFDGELQYPIKKIRPTVHIPLPSHALL